MAGTRGIPADATAVVLNVTAVEPTASGYVTAYPSGTGRPTASNLNFVPGQTRPNLVLVKVGTGGRVRLFNSSGTTHLVADATGYFRAQSTMLGGGEMQALSPTRILDTRSGLGGSSKVGGGQEAALRVTGIGGVPSLNVDSVVLNVTVTEPTASGFVTVYPSGTSRPNASSLNFVAGQTVPNLVVAKVGSNGVVNLFNSAGSTHLVADVVGWYSGTSFGSGSNVGGLPTGSGGQPTGGSGPAPPPSGGAAGTAGDLAVSPSDSQITPTPAEAQAAPALPGGDDDLPSAGDLPLPSTGPLTQAFNEPLYGYRSADYAGSVAPAVGRVIQWDYIQGQGWYRTNSCSGTVVGPDIVLTAGHCVYSPDHNAQLGPYEAYSFLPGLNGASAPYGEWFAPAERAFVHQAYIDGINSGAQWAPVLDYAFIKLPPADNNGLRISSYTGSFQVAMESAWSTPNKFGVGYPVEGAFSSKNGGGCDNSFQGWGLPGGWACYPWYCDSWNGGYVDFGGGWYDVGWGCLSNGGSSGGGVFAQIGSTWYVVSLTSLGGYIYDINGNLCQDRATCSWTMRNSWGPQFRQGWLDSLWQYAQNA